MRTIPLLAAIVLIAGCAQLPQVDVPAPPAPQARAVVFDIDGTLTPGVYAVGEVRPDAAKAVRMYSDKGYRVIYLSTRINFLQSRIPAWLKDNGFPGPGNLHTSQNDEEHNNPAAFKARILKEYRARGWSLVGGYGDSSTDFQAYAEAGIKQDHVFAIRRRGEITCEWGKWQDCLQGWTDHLGFIASRND
jgi:phosphatidate phosphatase PAH1